MSYLAAQLYASLVVEFIRAEKVRPTEEQCEEMARHALNAFAVFDRVEGDDYRRRTDERFRSRGGK